MLRDMMMRYGHENIGFTWVILEPMLFTGGVMIVWSLWGDHQYGVKVTEFVLTGYVPLTLWRHATSGVVTLCRRSAALLYHRSVSLFDIVFARICLEFVGSSAAFLLIWGSLNTLGIVGDIARLDLLIVGWLMQGWLAGAVALIVAAQTQFSETSERVIPAAQYLLLPICGAFLMTDWLPDWAQQFILLIPLVHPYEVFRAGYFGARVVTHYSFVYFSVCTFILTFFGVLWMQRARFRIDLT